MKVAVYDLGGGTFVISILELGDGLFIGLLLYMKKTEVKLLTVLDNVAIATPVTACCIRLGNLMNSEIIGSPTDVPWAFIFHTSDAFVDGQLVPRHPAQLYEAIAYLIIFFVGIAIYRRKNAPQVGTGFYFGFCLTTIFVFRFFYRFCVIKYLIDLVIVHRFELFLSLYNQSSFEDPVL